MLYRATYSVLGVNHVYYEKLIPPQRGEKVGGGCRPFGKDIHIVDNIPSSNTTLFLRPLILNFLSATVSTFLQKVAYPFQKRSTNILWKSKQSGFIARIIWVPDGSIQVEFFHRRLVVCGLGSIRCSLIYMEKDKKNLRHNWMGR